MRIVGGKHKGRRLAAPAGREVRPTSERVREALFNILAHGGFGEGLPQGAKVLDVFAGSGALGLEALSRGAAQVSFIENDRRALALLRQNAEAFGSDRVAVYQRDATQPGPVPAAPGLPADLVLLDAPYGQDLGEVALEALWNGGWLARAIACVELSSRESFAVPAAFELLDERRYGGTRLLILRASAPPE
ncbi:MAG TPA: 16S rRNA (guanine(966)-N(2))-methyltransferase RsmD [Alphaproteobacteria bacterium]|jgi:16S rRNA (guanine966-N2)-methyltransferase|nr:16S rRNA (guanine(966)-N(2))-methyltransferase RsmD [Alphaproteobacteria bacterium]MDP6269729.1 16S rRNA (guanine(966)-N(2))-methyltransferase RsmD [Alphaproteobacteria bacterium]MDP7165077.1 16S rRNA (guanine(966)-N(2))-methyltransferase RsmD [Alphaproteobacteria bacterium]MDP7429113.1 16S rRNA (guanine(966)-N(2))-methyltransferase RsmD [Alphaproteobacteria bacterium]HJM51511.1 16S rRNA (guanine(966)-N(2))-methyltransferase RsmD [Alphaproteobacteria bacterium]